MGFIPIAQAGVLQPGLHFFVDTRKTGTCQGINGDIFHLLLRQQVRRR